MNEPVTPAPLLMFLEALRERAMSADSINALAFTMANDLHAVLPFRQALVFAEHGKRCKLVCASGLAMPTEDSPYLVWLDRANAWVASQVDTPEPRWLARDAVELPPALADGWAEWWPKGVWCVPVHAPNDKRQALLLVLLDDPPTESFADVLRGVIRMWGYCWWALSRRSIRFGWRPTRRQSLVALAAAALFLMLPVRQTVLAPAEIVSSDARIISSPINGVIASLAVRPNQRVAKGALLFSLDETSLRSRVDVLRRQVAVADAELNAASQRAFDNAQSKNELTVLNGVAEQRRAELAAVTAQLQRTQVYAPESGVAVFSDPNDWIGKPVVTGERILQLADAAKPAILVHLAVADAIALDPGAEVTLYLTAWPLAPLHGRIVETSYEAKTTDEDIVAYRLLASIDGEREHARLGLHGTAKVYGQKVSLAYYLLRRPLASLRAWTGL
ncbi:HlyD family efflux transporter periplasmic adaptor subunit [Paraburkholderia sp. BL17N1]|uniref:efflux RND transporter periplasmic adaptor subunit n=1 Tax=Paraburkholderia sp. BL17N1 TaxID=1938798 RepID=UPI000EAFFA2B|nr:HlyD family efflux transporter periplasmic adaptor subunit [Paraburkholderia sp. BL17N1]RKR37643.1 CusB/HlyD membrane fusion family barrel-sandwich protein [Paraburkholderia sp. BL17N1]